MSLTNTHFRSTDMEAIKITKQRLNVRKIPHNKGHPNAICETMGHSRMGDGLIGWFICFPGFLKFIKWTVK